MVAEKEVPAPTVRGLLGWERRLRRDDSRDWEVKLEPPVNRVLPVSRGAFAKLWKAFEGE